MHVFSLLPAALFLPAAVTQHQTTNLPVRTDYKHLTLQACQVQCCQQVLRLTADKTAGDEARSSHTAPVWRTAAASFQQVRRDKAAENAKTASLRPSLRPPDGKPRAGTSEEPGPRRPGELKGGVEVMRNSVRSSLTRSSTSWARVC